MKKFANETDSKIEHCDKCTYFQYDDLAGEDYCCCVRHPEFAPCVTDLKEVLKTYTDTDFVISYLGLNLTTAHTYAEAEQIVKDFENEDRINNCYRPNSYEIGLAQL